MSDYHMQKQFDDWFYELEGYSFRSERMIDDLYYASETKDVSMMISWIKSAFEQGYISGKGEKND